MGGLDGALSFWPGSALALVAIWGMGPWRKRLLSLCLSNLEKKKKTLTCTQNKMGEDTFPLVNDSEPLDSAGTVKSKNTCVEESCLPSSVGTQL